MRSLNQIENIVLFRRNIRVSFEFFPPKTEGMENDLWHSIDSLKSLDPSFVSVTYGAGGSTRDRTHRTLERIVNETSLKPAAHLTCIGSPKEEVLQTAQNYWNAGVKHIVALRGDIKASTPTYQLHEGGFKYANELVAALKTVADFEISVAGYPEKHPEAKTLEMDIGYLKEKVDAGSDRVITQFFFDCDSYFRFVDKCLKAGINVPIIPGILPVTNVKQAKNFAKMCDIDIPHWMEDIFLGLDDHERTKSLVAAMVALEQCKILFHGGVNDFHFYTLNRSELTYAICHMFGIRPKELLTKK